MTELEKAARMALEASTKAVGAMRGIYGGWRCESAIKACEDAAAALTQALATTAPVKPLFATKVAAQKWAELQEQGHRMQTIWFDGGPGGAGTIDPWGKVTWSKTEPATTERKGEPSIPAGWVACRIEHEPGYPEDVAYGPQRMMDRLKKWLDKHFANTSPQAPEGFALVPVEPTPEMKSAGIKVEVYSEVSDSIGVLTWGEVRAIYRAMLDAARKGE